MNATATAGLSRNLIQFAYVTNDFDRALREFAAHHGVPKFFELRDFDVETAPGRVAKLHVGLAWAGGVQIEIIQPLGGADEVYHTAFDGTDGGFVLRFHHVAHMLETEADFDAVATEYERQRTAIVLRGSANGGMTRYFYADCRATLGHFVEYIWYAPEARGFFAMIPKAG